MEKQKQLTTVHIVPDLYTTFNNVSKVTFRQLVNRAMDLYLRDPDFKEKIDCNFDLLIKDTKL